MTDKSYKYTEPQFTDIGNRLRKIREDHGINQETFADDILHVQRSTLSEWERGIRPPSLAAVMTLCDLYGLDADYILGRIDCPTHDIQFIHDQTGLSVKAIKKLIQFKHDNKFSAHADIVSLLLEHINAEYLISLIADRVSVAPSQNNDIDLHIDFDGSLIHVRKTTFIDSQISTAIISDLPDIVSAYRRRHTQTPIERRRDYDTFCNNLLKQLHDDAQSGKISDADITDEYRAAVTEYLK